MPVDSRIAVFAGSFDPLTNGHADVIRRSAPLFDRLIVAVLVNASKQPLFSADERVAMIRRVVADRPDVEVDTFDGLLAEYARARGATVAVRGLRTPAEFTEDWQMALVNRHLNVGLETLFMPASAECAHISSRLVKEIARLGGPIDGLVPPAVAAHLATRRLRAGTQSV
jgi:pantetheine-phosphate adenylyltransferase